VSVSAPVYRFPPELVERYGKLVSEVAEAVTREIGSFEKCVCSS
jgi:DNA-binding IclR family transcriptional regulator